MPTDARYGLCTSRRPHILGLAVLVLAAAFAGVVSVGVVTASGPNPLVTPDPTGSLATFAATGTVIDFNNPFFQSMGTNGRTCATCHVAADAWTVVPPDVQARFTATGGSDPIFRTVDGSNSPLADVSTVAARQVAYSMLLGRATIRVGLPIPSNAEFALVAVQDPYNFASAAQLSLFRRPLPSTNLGFLSAVMWDGRESSAQTGTTPVTDLTSLENDLQHQALDATMGHAQATTPPSSAQLQQIQAFELALFTAQQMDNAPGELDLAGATGGPVNLSVQPFFIGINPLQVSGSTVEPANAAMTLFNAWASSTATANRQAVARGEALFTGRTFTTSGVAGLNDSLGMSQITGTCSTCHNTPNVGNHSTAVPLNLGLAAAAPPGLPVQAVPGQPTQSTLPLYTLQNVNQNSPNYGQQVQTTDPGRALITGKWSDIGKFKGPILRGLAARAPYFHNGSAASLDRVLDFYNARFNIGLSAHEHADLVAFLRSL
jgi:cytochrome c peroxidase